MTNREELVLAGMDVEDFLARIMNNEALVSLFVSKFVADGSYGALCAAIAEGDMKAAEFACHTLKGMCGNLSLGRLFDLFVAQLALFRAGRGEEAVAMMADIAPAWEDALVHLRAWLAS